MKIDKILRTIVVAGIFAIPAVVPFIVSSSLFFPFITGKNFTFRIITEIIFAAWLLLALRHHEYRPKFSWIGGAVAVFMGILLLADIFAENPGKAFWSNFERMEGFVSLFHMAMYFVVAGSTLLTEKIWDWFWHLPIASAIGLFLYGMLQLKGELVINQGGVRLDGTLGNATYLAGFLVFAIFLSLFFASRREIGRLHMIVTSWVIGSGIFIFYHVYPYFGKMVEASRQSASTDNISFFYGDWSRGLFYVALIILAAGLYVIYKHPKWGVEKSKITASSLYVITALILFMPLYNTATRGAMLGLIGGLLLTALIIIVWGKGALMFRKIAIGGAVLIVLSAGVFFIFKDSDFVKNNETLGRLTSISTKSGDAQARFMVWNMARQGVKERPILGWGQEGFNYVFNKYYNPNMYLREQWFDRTHNIVFDWLISAGILGLLGYLSLIVFAVVYVVGKAPRFFAKKMTEPTHPFSVTEKALLIGMISAYFFQNLFVFDNVVSYIMLFSLLAYLHSRSAKPIHGFEKAEAVSSPDIARFYAPIMIVVLVAVMWFVNVKSIMAADNLINALQTQPGGVMQNLEYFQSALGQSVIGTQEIREQLVQAAANLVSSTEASITADTKSAFVALASAEMEKQIKETPNDARVRIFLGSFYSIINNAEAAIREMEEALKLSPNKQVIKASLANVYLRIGNAGKAAELMKSAYESAPQFTDLAVGYTVSLIYAQMDKEAESMIKSFMDEGKPIDGKIIQAYLAVGQNSKAINLIRKIIDKNPEFKTDGEALIKDIQAGKYSN
ncbi:MAG: hypothetical protein A3B08_04475 [Candidatus Taylorbacteria bacterium RIFCSPLOWO2_01_FULL_43_44]|uniref:O-antigen ligase-related domain-containing protein n=1 Tax=Candidatus Taylorbacteria bacterium RIFCSPHIGHO2_02_FULL_43_32b TaxID=1802306 RepID=A0A1G2MI84_9BACT|nr:MAG: hypothetical protein A3C72_01610 [Candidatus Taylorbacteria bacterium RIFCSPHIGHO2_02_FULL_43_32b]OHA30592.1 MAG: hypothetical protein A3B08_04475 [Candidatus Taylorbacteria bacterium RIFCSPLOWO2_01_FULL_43_44]